MWSSSVIPAGGATCRCRCLRSQKNIPLMGKQSFSSPRMERTFWDEVLTPQRKFLRTPSSRTALLFRSIICRTYQVKARFVGPQHKINAALTLVLKKRNVIVLFDTAIPPDVVPFPTSGGILSMFCFYWTCSIMSCDTVNLPGPQSAGRGFSPLRRSTVHCGRRRSRPASQRGGLSHPSPGNPQWR